MLSLRPFRCRRGEWFSDFCDFSEAVESYASVQYSLQTILQKGFSAEVVPSDMSLAPSSAPSDAGRSETAAGAQRGSSFARHKESLGKPLKMLNDVKDFQRLLKGLQKGSKRG